MTPNEIGTIVNSCVRLEDIATAMYEVYDVLNKMWANYLIQYPFSETTEELQQLITSVCVNADKVTESIDALQAFAEVNK